MADTTVSQTTGSLANALSDIATLLERGALTPSKAAEWLRSLASQVAEREKLNVP